MYISYTDTHKTKDINRFISRRYIAEILSIRRKLYPINQLIYLPLTMLTRNYCNKDGDIHTGRHSDMNSVKSLFLLC